MIDRGTYWQCGYIIRKGTDAKLRAAGIEAFRQRLVGLQPWLADRITALRSFDEVKLLEVRLERLRRWYADGLLFIGDAAHAMSPVGGVGINLAVQDAVAAARILAPALRAGGAVPVAALRRVQIRRWWPTALIQAAQRLAHRVVVLRALAEPTDAPAATSLPAPLRLLQRFPALQGIPGRWSRSAHCPSTRRTGPAARRSPARRVGRPSA